MFFIIITAQKMKFSIRDFSSKCDQILRKLQIWSHLLEKSLMEKFIFFCSKSFTHYLVILLLERIYNFILEKVFLCGCSLVSFKVLACIGKITGKGLHHWRFPKNFVGLKLILGSFKNYATQNF